MPNDLMKPGKVGKGRQPKSWQVSRICQPWRAQRINLMPNQRHDNPA